MKPLTVAPDKESLKRLSALASIRDKEVRKAEAGGEDYLKTWKCFTRPLEVCDYFSSNLEPRKELQVRGAAGTAPSRDYQRFNESRRFVTAVKKRVDGRRYQSVADVCQYVEDRRARDCSGPAGRGLYTTCQRFWKEEF